MARLQLNNGLGLDYICKNGRKIGYIAEGEIPLHCEFDVADNTTCTSGPLVLPIKSWGPT